ncbi:conserved Plasmodium protein, unknown function [Plasmodium ovale]|uniref:Uncharacterized protein n=1 Tax=Plasmodium ovale TaxID=36330 RepID=A0A1D3TJH2_PLAOA|nr:conserved Plasmodium protein, unknown function [Plasmodium ovale]
MSYGWLTESTLFGKKEEIIELSKDKLFNENKSNTKNENSIDQLNGIVNSYLQNLKENKKNEIGRKKLTYQEKLYRSKNEGVEKRNKQDKKDSLVNKKISKMKRYKQLQNKGNSNPTCLVNFESKKEVERELEEIRKLKERKMSQRL